MITKELMKIECPVCKKELTPKTNEELCPNSPYKHGKHPIFIIKLDEDVVEWREFYD